MKTEPAIVARLSNATEAVLTKSRVTVFRGSQHFTFSRREAENLAAAMTVKQQKEQE